MRKIKKIMKVLRKIVSALKNNNNNKLYNKIVRNTFK